MSTLQLVIGNLSTWYTIVTRRNGVPTYGQVNPSEVHLKMPSPPIYMHLGSYVGNVQLTFTGKAGELVPSHSAHDVPGPCVQTFDSVEAAMEAANVYLEMERTK